MTGGFRLRRAHRDDAVTVLGLFDSAVDWLVAEGLTEQWGDRPWSRVPRRVEQVASWLGGEGSWLAEAPDGSAAGFLHLGVAPGYVPAATVPEDYVVALVTSRAPEARGAGRALLDHALREATGHAVDRLRVDCFAGNGGRLVAFYESCGFTRTERFTVGESWVGQVLVRDLG